MKVPFSFVLDLMWIPFVLGGLYFQSKYPIALIFSITVFIVFYIVAKNRIIRPKVSAILFICFGAIVAMFMPALFSKMPILSFSWSFYLLAGASALLWMNQKFAITLFWTLVLYCLVDTFFAFYQILHLGNTRPGGLFMDSNVRAIYVLVSILFVFWQLSDPTYSSKSKPAALWMVLLVLLAGFHSAQSRAMLALGGLSLLALWAYALLRAPEQRKSVLGFTIVSLLGFAVFYGLFQFVPSDGLAYLNKGESPDVRFELWATAWQLIKEHPYVGHGFGLFLYLYPSVRTEMGTAGHFVHNDFLEHWLASGIPGLVLTLIPVTFFTYQFFKSFAKAQYQQTLFAGIGLCLMGYAFFNYFFWRLENLIVMAAVWRLAEYPSGDITSVTVQPKHRFIALLIFLLPTISSLAKVEESIKLTSVEISSSVMSSWSDWVLVNESRLIPVYARQFFIQSINGNNDEIDFDRFSALIAQLDSEIRRGTLFPAFYCARAELSYLLNESYETGIAYVVQSEKLDPFDIYCAYARFNLAVVHNNPSLALEQIRKFLSNKLSMQRADAIINLNSVALEYANKQQAEEYVVVFTQYGEYLKNRKLELGL